jgi:DNA helicase IV
VSETVSAEARAIIAEEEALLAHVLAELRTPHPPTPGVDQSRFQLELKDLREQAATASESDLPRLFQAMNDVRALFERRASQSLPGLATPYFAHLRLKSTAGRRDYCLGRGTYADTAADIRIVDWRFAPIARIFYSYQEGDEYEESLPGGMAEGVVEARRVVVIERGVLTRIVAGSNILVRKPDGEWVQEHVDLLAGGTGSAARAGALGVGAGAALRAERADITALLDAEQFQALSSDADRPLLVIGSAGSGKTTVALHRLAKLAFDDPNRFPANRMRVIVPEPGLARLSRRLLAPLGLGRVRVETLSDWVLATAKAAFGLQKIKLCEEPPPLVSRLKRHPALRGVLLEHASRQSDASTSFSRFRSRLSELFTDRPLLRQVVDAAQGELPTTCIEATVQHTMQQIRAPMAEELGISDPERLKSVDGLSLEEGTPEELSGTSDPEDLALALYLKARSGGFHGEQISHLVLDEAEDFSLFELFVLGHQVAARKKSCTLAGDEMQQTFAGFAGWPAMLDALGAKNAATCRLQVSYRCPEPVVELAQRVLGEQAPDTAARAGRPGAPVGMHRFPDAAQVQLFLAGALRDLSDREPNASVGVIANDPETARSLYRSLEALPRVRLVLDGSFTFEPGIDVTDVDSVKGLEFDYVVIPDATISAYPTTPESRRRLHVAVTRTSYQLWLLSSGTWTPLVANPSMP